MMWTYSIIQIYASLLLIYQYNAITSPIPPFVEYAHSAELQTNVADLWWSVNDTQQEITFELHIRSLGWIALGISPAGGMKGADIAIMWVDSQGKVVLQDRYASGESKPMIDDTTQDWFALQGREQNGWTAIQFKRLLDTCDPMDYTIKSGTNNLIFAYGLVDPDSTQSNGDITYHDTRRGSRRIPLRSYNDPPSEGKFANLETFEWRLNNYLVPSTDTTYHCKVHKAPSHLTTRRHSIAHKMIIDPANIDLVHHLLLYECDPAAVFDEKNLPDGLCDDFAEKLELCSSNIATGWAVGGDFLLEFPQEAGYPIGGDFPVKYYLLQMHYDNPRLQSGRRDSSGIRFYLSNELRGQELGFLTLGTSSSVKALAIPPKVNNFIIDSYCLPEATQNFPKDGITVTAAFPHTHLQGKTVWSKLIRNGVAVQYLFNADAFDFNYQFNHRLPEPIKLYPGGEKTKNEMCLNMFTYYPRMNDMYMCATVNHPSAWKKQMNVSEAPSSAAIQRWLQNITWTHELKEQWQQFYNNAPRRGFYGRSGQFHSKEIKVLPSYKDLPSETCQNSTGTRETLNLFLMLALFCQLLISNS
ncbi:unnamed protein product [Adineta ricciae]|uniref:DOMON domain-containing protein n=1 Tax=Adineta ricciae TaxID=249248 RepID=A0A813Y460_ADIRI|nr:unnamed protein product [Adineta ricciae]CAF1105184.1 unnamed protein product [Adineta ricciae]